jgi:hypothetical protein
MKRRPFPKETKEAQLKRLWKERYPAKTETDEEWLKNYAKARNKWGLDS